MENESIFDKLKDMLTAKGVKRPEAMAGYVGRKRYGDKGRKPEPPKDKEEGDDKA